MSTLAPPAPFVSEAPRSHVCCPDCRTYRVVTMRQARRIRTGENSGVCSSCRGEESEIRPYAEEHLAFWLTSFGVAIPPGGSARSVILAGLVPDDLIALARAVWPH